MVKLSKVLRPNPSDSRGGCAPGDWSSCTIPTEQFTNFQTNTTKGKKSANISEVNIRHCHKTKCSFQKQYKWADIQQTGKIFNTGFHTTHSMARMQWNWTKGSPRKIHQDFRTTRVYLASQMLNTPLWFWINQMQHAKKQAASKCPEEQVQKEQC